MIGWLLDLVPLWAWAIAAAAILGAIWWHFGWRGLYAASAALAALFLYRQGRKAGADDALERQKRTDEKAVKDYERIKSETAGLSDDDLDAANAPWVRRPGGKR